MQTEFSYPIKAISKTANFQEKWTDIRYVTAEGENREPDLEMKKNPTDEFGEPIFNV